MEHELVGRWWDEAIIIPVEVVSRPTLADCLDDRDSVNLQHF